MSATAPGLDRAEQPGPAPGGGGSSRWRRARPAVLVLALLTTVVVIGALLVPETSGGRLDPRSADPSGARAVAQVLERRGVTVTTVATVEEAVAQAGPGSTLVVVSSTVLPPDRLDTLASGSSELVLVEPDGPVLDSLAPGLSAAGRAEPEVRAAGCDAPHAEAASSALAGGQLVRLDEQSAAGSAAVCFPDEADASAGSYATVQDDGRTVQVIGQGDLLTNEHLDEAGNAALALRALGGAPELVWLMASPLDTSADEEVSPLDLLPRWVVWVGVWLVVVALLTMVWRARRLGRLVPEPLPVLVRSAETAEGRAALYRAAGAHDRAGSVLRAATLRRLAARLGLPSSASAETVATSAARAAGRDERQVRGLLLGPPPTDGRRLVALADDLDALVADVHDSPAADRNLTADRKPTRESAHP